MSEELAGASRRWTRNGQESCIPARYTSRPLTRITEPARQLHFQNIMFYKTPVSLDKLRQEARNAAQSPLPLPFMFEALEDV